LNKLRKISESAVGATLIVTHSPCLRCAHEIVDSGIEKVYYKHQYRSSDGIEHLLKHGVDVQQIEN
jgi:dCMP deaminase